MSWRVLGAASAAVALAWACKGEKLECEACDSGCGGSGGGGGIVTGGGTGGGAGGTAATGGTSGAGATGASAGEAGTEGGAAGEPGGNAAQAGAGGEAPGGAAGAAGAAGAGGEPITECWAYTYGTADEEDVSGMVPAVGGGHWVWGARRVLPEGADVLLARLDEAGTVLFARSYGGTEPDFLNFRTLDDGGLIGGGFTRSFGANDWDAWIVRLDGAGDIVWQKALDGGEYDYLAPPRPASDGGFILVGETRSFGEPDGWLVKLSDAGELVWQRRYDMRDYDRLSSIVPVPGGYVAAGYTTDSSSNQDGWLIGVSSTGQFMWSRTYGGDGADLLGPVGNLADGGLLLRGTTSSAGAGGTDAWLMRLSPVGEILSSRTYGTGELDYFAWPRLQNDGSLLVAGYTVDETTGKEDVLLARIAATGEVEWAHAFGDPDLRDWALSWRSGWVAATTETWGAGDDDLLLLRPLPDGTCPGLELRDVALQVDTFYPAVRSHVLVASDTNAAIRDTDAVPVELTLTQESVF